MLNSSDDLRVGGETADSEFSYTVGDVARESGVTVSAIRFYEKHSIVSGVRTRGNQRRFTADAVCRIKVALLAQRVGYSVAEISDLLAELPREPQRKDWERLHALLIEDMERWITETQALLVAIKSGARLC